MSPLKNVANTLIKTNPKLAHLIPADGKVLDCETDRLAKIVAPRFGLIQSVVREFMDMTELKRCDVIDRQSRVCK